jgi:hypothetical protein
VTAARARQGFDRLEAILGRLAERRPLLALSAAGVVGASRNRLSRRWPSTGEVRALFPHLGRVAAALVAARIGALEARNRVQVRCVARAGLAPLRPLVSVADTLLALRGPGILATFHVGATHALGPALERLAAPVLALRLGSLAAVRSPVESVTTEGDEQQRAAVFYRAKRQLDDGGFVAMAVDVVRGAWIETACLGRPLRLARGAFALSALTAAPIVPLVSRWSRRGAHVVAGEPLRPVHRAGTAIDSRASEQALAVAAAAWLEQYLLGAPAELSLGLLLGLLRPPDPG